MIEKILRIQNVGLLQDACAVEKVVLDRVTGVFADNGRGKSTLAAVLRACTLGDADRLRARQTLDSDDPPQVRFLLPNGNHLRFDGNSWFGTAPEILVFDSEFVERNVYSGFEVRPDHRQALLSFALGDQTVQLTHDVERLTQKLAEQTSKRRQPEQALWGSMQPYALQEFLVLESVPDAQVQIDALHKRIAAAKSEQQLAARQNPSPLQQLVFNFEATFAVLAKEITDVEDSAEALVKAHLVTRNEVGFEEWISRGQQYMTSDDCPFCGQDVVGLELIRAYRTHFNEQYQRLKHEIKSLETVVASAFADVKGDAIAAAVATNDARIQAWADQLDLQIPTLDRDELKAGVEKIRNRLLVLISEKEKQPLVALGSQEIHSEIEETMAAVNRASSEYNSSIAAVAAKITEFKQSLAAENPSLLQGEIRKLEAAIKRHQPEVSASVDEYQAAEAEKKRLETEKKRVRENIDVLMASTLKQYQTDINQLLTTFGAEFSIEALKPSYKGSGEPRTEYKLSLRNQSVKLGSRADSTAGVGFGRVLSEGDKRTLAFSFFLARLKQETSLSEKVVVLDDPVSSLDRNRRHNSIRLICEIATGCGQLLVLSHDAYFVRDLRDALADLRPAPIPFPVWTLKRAQQQYSVFQRGDIDDICASPYYRHHQLVADYVSGTGPVDIREVAKMLRPLLEGYYHRRFPGCIPKRLMFGQIIALAVDPETVGPLVHLRPLEKELREVNEYVGQFHHDPNQSADTVQIVDAELMQFSRRTLQLIYENG